MAFLKTARADVIVPDVTPHGWSDVRVASTQAVAPSLVEQASKILEDDFSPEKYLLTHCTIVASVDTEEHPGVKVGMFQEGPLTVDRKYPKHWITPDTQDLINNNFDSWSRPVLMKSYKTFIGAHNWVEHVQKPELSKGRVIDAVIRDIGRSLYVDILVATARKHEQLIKDILEGRMSTLSMGCSVLITQCTKCGHVATDETTLCPHIKYEKGNHWYDDFGNRRRIAELCGHESIEPNAGVNFIEASWVAVPAFRGAVLRNIVDLKDVSPAAIENARQVLASPPQEWTRSGVDDFLKVAKVLGLTPEFLKQAQDEVEEEEEAPAEEEEEAPAEEEPAEEEEEPAEEEEEPAIEEPDEVDDDEDDDKEQKTPMEELKEDVVKHVTEEAKSEILEQIKGQKDTKAGVGPIDSDDNIVKQAYLLGQKTAMQKMARAGAYQTGVKTLIKTASSPSSFVASLIRLNRSFGIEVPGHLYRVAHRVGSIDRYPDLKQYFATCGQVMQRQPTVPEATTLVRIGSLLSKFKGFRNKGE